MAVKAFSPPLKDNGELIFFPGGIAKISIPVLSKSSGLLKDNSPFPP